MKKRKTKRTVTLKAAVAWYKPNQWQRLREISEDRDELEKTFWEWEILAENAMKDLNARGLPLTKITVDTEELLLWCNERGLNVTGESRSQYASWLLQEEDKKEGESDG
jgi:hypothetical protein